MPGEAELRKQDSHMLQTVVQNLPGVFLSCAKGTGRCYLRLWSHED